MSTLQIPGFGKVEYDAGDNAHLSSFRLVSAVSYHQPDTHRGDRASRIMGQIWDAAPRGHVNFVYGPQGEKVNAAHPAP